VGIDIGYRLMPDGGQRVAYWQGSDGASGELRLPPWTVESQSKIEDLQSIRDKLHNAIRTRLKDWLEANPHPEWLDEATEHMHAWKRLARLDCLVVEWRGKRFDGDTAILKALEAWRKQERHLWQWQENSRDQLLEWRKNYYREFAAAMRRRYRTVAVEDMDLRSAIHDILRPEEERETVTAQRRMARFAALSVLVGCLKDSGSEVVTVDRAGTTGIHHDCGHVNDVGADLMHVCEGCGIEFDRDVNAAKNILARGEVAVVPAQGISSCDRATPAYSPPDGNGNSKKPTRSQRLVSARKTRSGVKTGKELG
jgi:hypothetical protein